MSGLAIPAFLDRRSLDGPLRPPSTQELVVTDPSPPPPSSAPQSGAQPRIEVEDGPRGIGFVELLAYANGGEDARQLDGLLTELIAHLENLDINEGQRKSKASLTVKVRFERDGGSYSVVIEAASKLPEAPRQRSIFWATAGNRLSANNPRQMDMFPRRRTHIVS